jgi:hypothetical protein
MLLALLVVTQAQPTHDSRQQPQQPPPPRPQQHLLLARPLPSDAADWVVSQTQSEPAVSMDYTAASGLELPYNFSAAPSGTTYLGVRWTPPAAGGLLSQATVGSSLGLQLRVEGSHWGFLRVQDATQQYFQASWSVNASTPRDEDNWTTLTQLIEPAQFTSHFAGKNDGRIHLPLRAVEIDLGTARPPEGRFAIANLSLSCPVGCVAGPFGGWQVELGSSRSSAAVGVVTTEAAGASDFRAVARLVNLLHHAGSLRIAVSLYPDDVNSTGVSGVIGCLASSVVTVGGWDSHEVVCKPESALAPGFYTIRAQVGQDALSGKMPSGRATVSAVFEGGLVVLATNLSLSAPAPGAFGSQSAKSPEAYAALRSAGASNLRIWIFWRYAEGTEGRYEWSATDDQIRAAVAAGQRVTLTIASRAPTWAKWSKDPSGMWADPGAFSKLERFCGLIAERYYRNESVVKSDSSSRGSMLIESIEIDNEPDAMLWDLHLPLAVAAGAYEGIVTSCGRGIRAVATAKELPAVGLSIDGQGYWESKGGNLTFARRVLTNKTVARMLHGKKHVKVSLRLLPIALAIGFILRRDFDRCCTNVA